MLFIYSIIISGLSAAAAAFNGLLLIKDGPDKTKIVHVCLYVLSMVIFIEAITEKRWFGTLVGVQLEAPSSPGFTLMLSLMFLSMAITGLKMGFMGIYRLFRHKEETESNQHILFSLAIAFGVMFMSAQFFQQGWWNETKIALQDIGTSVIQSIYSPERMIAEGTISDKYECIACNQIDSSVVWVGRTPSVSPSHSESQFHIRVNDQIFNVDQSQFDELFVGDHVRISYNYDVVIDVQILDTKDGQTWK